MRSRLNDPASQNVPAGVGNTDTKARRLREGNIQLAKLRRASASRQIPILMPVVIVLVMCAYFCVLSLHAMSRGPVLTPDSAVYLSAAHNLVSGKGLTTGFNPPSSVMHPAQVAAVYGRVPLAQYGPFYPILLALLQFIGFSVDNSIRAVGVLALAAFIGLVAALAMRALERRTPLVALMVLACIVAPELPTGSEWNPLGLSAYALSDLLFYTFVVAFFLATDIWLRTQSRMSLIVMVVIIVAAVLTRYAGVSLAAVAALAVLSEGSKPRRPRVKSAIVVGGSGVAAYLIWDFVNKIAFHATSPRTLAFHPNSRLAQEMLHVAASWFFPGSWPTGLTSSATAAIFTAVVVFSLFPPARRRLVGSSTRGIVPVRLWRIGGLFLICYTGLLVVTSIWMDAQLGINGRVFGPLQITLYLLIGSMIYWAIRNRLVAAQSQWWAIASVILATAVLWPPYGTLAQEITFVYPQSPSVSRVPSISASKFVMTTDTARVYLSYANDSILLPYYRFPTTEQVNREFHQDLIDVGKLIRQHHGVVIEWPDSQQGFPSTEQLETVAHLMPVGQLPDGGVVYTPR